MTRPIVEFQNVSKTYRAGLPTRIAWRRAARSTPSAT